jgi:hypothetical protein
MNELMNTENTQKFTSVYLVEQINIFRKEEGKSALLHKNLLAKIEDEFEEEIGQLKIQPTSYLDKSNRESKCYELDFEESLQLLMSESKKVRKQVVVKLKQLQSKVSMPTTYLQALEVLVKTEKEKQLLELKTENLQIALDNDLKWCSIIKVSSHNKIKEKKLNWRVLKSMSKKMGFDVKRMPSKRYEYQLAYHVSVFCACYPELNYDFIQNK